MWKTISILLVCSVVVGCVNQAGARMGLFEASAPVVAILHDDLFTGEAIGYPDHTGTITLTSSSDPKVKCMGSFEYTGSKIGKGQVNCNDGNSTNFQFNSLSMLSGYGYGNSSRGTFSFTYGLTAEESQQYLKLPKGKVIKKKADKLHLYEI